MRLNPQGSDESEKSTRREHTAVMGTIGYLEVQPQYRALEVGAVLLGRVMKRTAAATEAHYLLLRNVCDSDPISDTLPYRRIAWRCNSLNAQSRRHAERFGYKYEGTFRNHIIAHGRSRDSDWLSIVDVEWPRIKMALEKWLQINNFDNDGQQIKSLEDIRESLS